MSARSGRSIIFSGLPSPVASGAVVRDAVVLALVLDDVAPQRRADDLDVLARLAERLAPRLAVPALDDLRARTCRARG